MKKQTGSKERDEKEKQGIERQRVEAVILRDEGRYIERNTKKRGKIHRINRKVLRKEKKK